MKYDGYNLVFYKSNREEGDIMFFKRRLLTVVALSCFASLSAVAANQQQITLSGTITAVSCEVVLNGGQSTLNVGGFPAASFTSAGANTQVGAIPLNISLTGCDKASAEGKGSLLIQGLTPAASNSLFVDDISATVGFMLKDADSNQITNNTPIPLDVAVGANTYSMSAGMGSLTATPANGIYTAPIVVAYVSD